MAAPMKIGGRAHWTATDLLVNPYWGIHLTDLELFEIDRALNISKTYEPPIEWEWKEENDAGNVPVNVDTNNFPLDALARRMSNVAEEIEHGSGAVMIANMPIDRYSIDELAVIYLGMSAHIGHIVKQSSSGLRSKSRGFGMPLVRPRQRLLPGSLPGPLLPRSLTNCQLPAASLRFTLRRASSVRR